MSLFYFTEFDINTRLPVRSKYNFDFTKYATDRNLGTNDKEVIFQAFLDENGIDYSKPTTCKQDLIQYFTPMTNTIIDYINNYGYTIHTNYMSSMYLNSYVSFDQLVASQFDLIEYNDTEIRFIQDYYYTNVYAATSDINYYTKYNFDFDSFSQDFNVWGTKLTVFTDFMVRCIYLSNSVVGSFGYGITEYLKKYFVYFENLESYLIQYCVTSDLSYEYKYPNNINYESYREMNEDLKSFSIPFLKNHYLHYGQFEIRTFLYDVKPLTNYDLIQSSLSTVYTVSDERIGSGFLFDYNDGKKYLVTCFHILKSSNINIIRGNFSYKNSYNTLEETISVTADFRVLGYDRFTDILVGVYDPTLNYNVFQNNSEEINKLKSLKIDNLYNLKVGEEVSYIGNIGYDDTASLLIGTLIDNNYAGGFGTSIFGSPQSLIIETSTAGGFSGSPICIGDMKSTDGNFKCVGILNSSISEDRYTQAIGGRFSINVISNIILNGDYYLSVFGNDIVTLNYFQSIGYPLKWFGVIGNYFNSVKSIKEYPELSSMKYNGGYIITDFIVGFNSITNKFVINAFDLGKLNIIRLKTAFLNSKIYKQYIDSSNRPIVIKSITFFNGVNSSFQKYYLGKYGNQVGLNTFTFGFNPISFKPSDESGLIFPFLNYYANTIFEYYYYDGEKYSLDTETIISDDSFTATYVDGLGNKMTQNKWEMPIFLYSYIDEYWNTMKTYQISGLSNNQTRTDSSKTDSSRTDSSRTSDPSRYY